MTEIVDKNKKNSKNGGYSIRQTMEKIPGAGSLAAGLALLAIAAALQMAARKLPGFATWYAHHIYPVLVGILGRISGWFPFSLVEFGLYLLIAACVIGGWRNRKHPWKIINRTVLLAGILFCSYTVNCGINYYAKSFSEYTGIRTELYSREELEELCRFLVARVNENVSGERYVDHKQEWKQEGVRAMAGLADLNAGGDTAASRFACMGGFYPKPKEVWISEILSVQQLCGIYSPFTIEANFNGDMPDYNVPHTICHELSHLKGFMREDEANFIGYLACVSSENQAFRYSGYLTGWVYAGNALARVDADIYRELRQQLDPEAEADLQENNAFWDRYEGKVAEASSQWNDTYLKWNDQEEGVQSYGRMVDLMLAYHKNLLQE